MDINDKQTVLQETAQHITITVPQVYCSLLLLSGKLKMWGIFSFRICWSTWRALFSVWFGFCANLL